MHARILAAAGQVLPSAAAFIARAAAPLLPKVCTFPIDTYNACESGIVLLCSSAIALCLPLRLALASRGLELAPFIFPPHPLMPVLLQHMQVTQNRSRSVMGVR